MASSEPSRLTEVRFEPDERPPLHVVLGLGLQLAFLVIASMLLIPLIVFQAVEGSEAYIYWAVFDAIVVGGITTILQAVRFGRVGAGYILMMGSTIAFVPVCITALSDGGVPLLASLVIACGAIQLLLSTRLSLLRRIVTQTVAGVIILLITVTAMPIVFDLLADAPPSSISWAGPVSALCTILVIICMAMMGSGTVRLWAPVAGIALGSVVAAFLGIYDFESVRQARWVGLPSLEWPGLRLEFGARFWVLLPAFVFVTLIDNIQTISYSVGIQHVSWRRPRAVDYKAIQGSLVVAGISNLLSGMAATVPNSIRPSSISMTSLTGVAARRVGIATGLMLLVLAFQPKVLAVLLAIPGPVYGAYVAIIVAVLFGAGMKMIVQDGINYRKGLMAGIAFWAGMGFEAGRIYPEFLSEIAGGLFDNGLTAGGLVAIVMTSIMVLMEPRRRRIEVALDVSSLPKIASFLSAFAGRHGLAGAMTNRMNAVSEETLLTLLRHDSPDGDQSHRRLALTAQRVRDEVVLEFIATVGKENIQDQMVLLEESRDESDAEKELSLRILRHFAKSVRHQQYHNTDVVTVRVSPPGA